MLYLVYRREHKLLKSGIWVGNGQVLLVAGVAGKGKKG
jgi:hypothetical protein